jgi:energy-coupling factor transport system ATP-binding protein
MLEARDLTVRYAGRVADGHPAAGPLDLELAPGEWVALVGANGSGKTALVLALAGLLPPAGGRLVLDGLDLADPAARREVRSRVGVVFQEPETQFVTDSVRREIAFPLENLGWERGVLEARVDELLDAFGLRDLAAAPPTRLSGGEMQRVALAAAVAHRPRYVLLDEPASYLDAEARAGLGRWTRARCRDAGMAVLWTACSAAECPEADRAVELPTPAAPAASAEPVRPAPTEAMDPSAPPASTLLWKGEGLRLALADERGRTELWGGLGFEVRRGERIWVRGPNGSGKTALLDLLAGWRKPTTGVWVDRRRAAGGEPARLGYLLQFPEDQLFAATVGEDVGFGLGRLRPRVRPAEGRERVAEALRQVGLDPGRVAGRSPEELSLGERRRAALAGVLVMQPVALLLDEPTAGLDPGAVAGWTRAVEAAWAAGTTVVVATHEPPAPGEPGRAIELPPAGRVAAPSARA